MGLTVLITGATSGFGEACARRFARVGCRLILTGRRADRLEKLAEDLSVEWDTETLALVFDVREREEVEMALGTLPDEWSSIDVLINNAGLALGLSPLNQGDIDDWDTMIDTNIKGLLYVSRAVSPGMVKRKTGHIINIGSVAGREVYPNGVVYSATKHAVDALTKGMRMDMVQHGIKVTQIAPGAAETEFSLVRFKGDDAKAAGIYTGFQPLLAEDIAEVAYYVTTLPPHVNINDLLIMPMAQASAMVWHKK